MFLNQILQEKDFVVTTELTPPRGTDTTLFIEQAEKLRYLTDAINVTDNPRATLKLSPLASARLLVERKLNPVLQFTCRDRNRLALQADILGAAVFGIKNLLIVTGDHIGAGTSGGKSVFDIDSVQLIKTVVLMASGQDLEGKTLQGKVDFCVGGVVNPGLHPKWPQLWKMHRKIEAGAEFFQAQAVFDAKVYNNFVNCFGEKLPPIIAGILLIRSREQLRFLRDKVPGIMVPPSLIEQMDRSKDPIKEGIDYLVNLVRKIKPYCRGIHLMAPGMEDMIPDFVKQLQS